MNKILKVIPLFTEVECVGISMKISRRDFLTATAFAGFATGRHSLCDGKVKFIEEYAATVRLFPYSTIAPTNPDALGVCLMYPPFEPLRLKLDMWRGRSIRIWGHPDNQWWDQILPTLKILQPNTLLIFNDKTSRHKEHIFYENDRKHNLYQEQEPKAVVEHIRFTLNKLDAAGIKVKNVYWEAWNEPQFINNGGWQPDAMAHYVNDIAASVRKASLPIRILAPIHMYLDEVGCSWNERLCHQLDVENIAGLVTHYYYYAWLKLNYPKDDFLRRASGGFLLEKRIHKNLELIICYGKGKWKLHCSEWGVLPEGYTPPLYVSRDMAAALYAFSAIKLYLENGLASSQYFLLSSTNGHFAAYTNVAKSILARPVALLNELFQEQLMGDVINVEVACPTLSLGSFKNASMSFDVPYLEAIACRMINGRVRLFLANKHTEKTAKVNFEGKIGQAIGKAHILHGMGGNQEIAVREVISSSNCNMEVPPASIISMLF